jgi:hypothetical protein
MHKAGPDPFKEQLIDAALEVRATQPDASRPVTCSSSH